MVHAVESNFSDYIQDNAYPWEKQDTIWKFREITDRQNDCTSR